MVDVHRHLDEAEVNGQNTLSKLATDSLSQGLNESVDESVEAFGDLLPYPKVPHLIHAGLDFLDNLPTNTGVVTEFSGQKAEDLNRYLIPDGVKTEIFNKTSVTPHGNYLHRYKAGRVPSKFHPHDFYLLKDVDDDLELYFVDPEKSIAERARWNEVPNVTNLAGMRLSRKGNDDRFFVGRIYSEEIPHQDLKMRHQLQVARGILTGFPFPKLVVNPADYKFAVSIYTDPRYGKVISRFTSKPVLDKLAAGESKSPEITRQINAAYRVMGQCINLLDIIKPYDIASGKVF